MAKFAQFRIFIGPIAIPSANAAHYDWSGLNYGSTAALPADTTLSATLSEGATSLTCASAAALPNKGGVWVGPNGAGQGWEYVRYTGKSGNTLTGLYREIAGDREHNGVHSSGAVVRMWWQVPGDDGTLRIIEEATEMFSAVTWFAEISGVNWPRAALRTQHLAVVQTRTSPSGAWAIELVGILESPRIKDDERRMSEWSVRIMSSAWLLARTEIAGVRIGDLDLAKYAISTGSDQELVDFTAQRYIGGIVEAEPDVSSGAAVDRKSSSSWMAERFIGTPNTPAPNGDDTAGLAFGLRFTGMYLNPPAGSRSGTRWIELTCVGGGTASGLSIFSAAGGGDMVQWYFGGGGGGLEDKDKIILCEDEAVYTETHPLSQHAFLKADYGFFAHIQAAGGTMALRFDALDQWRCIVKWGHGNGGLEPSDEAEPPTWYFDPVTPPLPGQTMRYLFNPGGAPSMSAHYWRTDYVQTAGYSIATSPASWLRVDLPRMGLVLGRDVLNDVIPGAGATLYITDGADASTTGLPASGTLQIGDEQIAYSAKNAHGVVVSARGANGTTAAAHVEGDIVYLVDGGVKTEAHLIKNIGWVTAGLASYPKQYRIKVSKLSDARNPDEAGYNADWTEVYATAPENWASGYTHTLSPSQRVASVLFQIENMTTDPARARISEVYAQADAGTFPAGGYMAQAQPGAVIEQLITNAGLPPGLITIAAPSGTPNQISGITTAKDFAWTVIADMADFAMARVTVRRDSKIDIEETPNRFAGYGVPVSQVWTRANAVSVEYLLSAFEPISQVVLPYRVVDAGAEGTVYYPETPAEYGKVLRVREMLFPWEDAENDYAFNLFFLRRFPFTALVEAWDAHPTMRPGEIHAVQWQADAAQPLATRQYIVRSTEHTIENQAWSTVLNLVEIDRQSAQ